MQYLSYTKITLTKTRTIKKFKLCGLCLFIPVRLWYDQSDMYRRNTLLLYIFEIFLNHFFSKLAYSISLNQKSQLFRQLINLTRKRFDLISDWKSFSLFFPGCLFRWTGCVVYDNELELHHHWLDDRQQQCSGWPLTDKLWWWMCVWDESVWRTLG